MCIDGTQQWFDRTSFADPRNNFKKGKFHDNWYKSLAKRCFYKYMYIYTVFPYSEALFLFWVYEWPGLVVVTRLVKHTKTIMKTENARCSRVNSILLSSLHKKSFLRLFFLFLLPFIVECTCLHDYKRFERTFLCLIVNTTCEYNKWTCTTTNETTVLQLVAFNQLYW